MNVQNKPHKNKNIKKNARMEKDTNTSENQK